MQPVIISHQLLYLICTVSPEAMHHKRFFPPSTTINLANYVRPHSSEILCMYLQSLSCKRHSFQVLKKVQKWATKIVKGYEKRLRSLGIYTLFCHRQHGDLNIGVFKFWIVTTTLTSHSFYTIWCYQHYRGHPMKLFQWHSRLNIRSNLQLEQFTRWNCYSYS